jgi:uncharacterized membrane protein YraQ (UPF0718 family)
VEEVGGGNMGFARINEWLTRFTAIMLTAFPLLVLGVVAYAVIEHFVTAERIVRWLPRQKWLAVPLAALLGLVLPVCDCGVVPTARALLRRELGIAPALAFLIGAPVINPIVFLTTAAGFGFNYTIAIARLLFTFAVAVGVAALAALAFGALPLDDLVLAKLAPPADDEDAPRHLHDYDHDHAHSHAHNALPRAPARKRRSRRAFHHRMPSAAPLPPWLGHATTIAADAGEQLLDLGRFLVIGALIAAAVQTFVPQAPLLSLGHGIFTSTLALMLLASILSLCSISDAPVAYSFLGTFAPGAVFAFMIFGQIVDIKNAAMLLATFRRTVVLFFIISSGLLVLALGALINLGVF